VNKCDALNGGKNSSLLVPYPIDSIHWLMGRSKFVQPSVDKLMSTIHKKMKLVLRTGYLLHTLCTDEIVQRQYVSVHLKHCTAKEPMM